MLKSYIDEELELTKETWVLSLIVQKKNSAFLVIEGIDENGERITQKVELLPNPKQNANAIIQYYSDISINLSLLDVNGYSYQSWSVSSEKIENELLPNLRVSITQGNLGHIKYSPYPKGKNANLFSPSTSAIISDPFTQSEVSSDSIIAILMSREGHNALTWANMMLNAINLRCEPDKLKAYVFKHPNFIHKQSNNSGCILF